MSFSKLWEENKKQEPNIIKTSAAGCQNWNDADRFIIFTKLGNMIMSKRNTIEPSK